jgi:hypothetical protein
MRHIFCLHLLTLNLWQADDMSVFCQKCGHRNVSDSFFCSSCGAALEVDGDKTVVIAKVDQLQDAIGPQDNATIDLRTLPKSSATLMVRSGPQAGERFVLDLVAILTVKFRSTTFRSRDVTPKLNNTAKSTSYATLVH